MTAKHLRDNQSGGPARKRKTIDLELRTKIIKNYENGQTLISFPREFDLATSVVKKNLKDLERIKDRVEGSASLKSTRITKKRLGAPFEKEKIINTVDGG
jgi:hypothetical protein